MASKLILRQYIPLPPHPAGGFDHGDVYLESGRVFVANTAAGTVEVIDGERLRHLATIPGCSEASGVLCAQDEAPGVINVVNTQSMTVDEQLPTEVGAHTTAYDALRQRLYVFLPSCRVAVYEEREVL